MSLKLLSKYRRNRAPTRNRSELLNFATYTIAAVGGVGDAFRWWFRIGSLSSSSPPRFIFNNLCWNIRESKRASLLKFIDDPCSKIIFTLGWQCSHLAESTRVSGLCEIYPRIFQHSDFGMKYLLQLFKVETLSKLSGRLSRNHRRANIALMSRSVRRQSTPSRRWVTFAVLD